MADNLTANDTAGRVIFGTMRLNEVDRPIKEWVDFFTQLHAMGVTRLHSSIEYDSFPLLKNILGKLRNAAPKVHFRHTVKLAEPGFNDGPLFSADRFIAKIDAYCESLGVDSIENVQWMWRQGLDSDGSRIKAFRESYGEIEDCVMKLKRASRIKKFICFPYTVPFAHNAVKQSAVDGIAVYRNVDETEYDAVIELCSTLNKTAFAIRPLNAGKALARSEDSARDLFDFALSLEPIEAGIISTSSLDHLRDLILDVQTS